MQYWEKKLPLRLVDLKIVQSEVEIEKTKTSRRQVFSPFPLTLIGTIRAALCCCYQIKNGAKNWVDDGHRISKGVNNKKIIYAVLTCEKKRGLFPIPHRPLFTFCAFRPPGVRRPRRTSMWP
jgi:hypothetical protein